MTTYTLTGKRQVLTMAEKAAMLMVSEIAGKRNLLFVSSGSRQHYGYEVSHDGSKATSCNCPAYGECSHEIAVDLYLQQPAQTCSLCGRETKGAVICGHCIGW